MRGRPCRAYVSPARVRCTRCHRRVGGPVRHHRKFRLAIAWAVIVGTAALLNDVTGSIVNVRSLL